MFFGVPQLEFDSFAPEVKLFLALATAKDNLVPTTKGSDTDKEFHFQRWVGRRLESISLAIDTSGRTSYPDYILKDHPVGFEVKGLGHDERVKARGTLDYNSKLPLAMHDGNKVYYVFGRYERTRGTEAKVHDLVVCAASFINADTEDNNKNTSFPGAGSYGDMLTRDRRMFTGPTPFTLLSGVDNAVTLILEDGVQVPNILVPVGNIERHAAVEKVVSYRFDLQNNKLTTEKVPNPAAGIVHRFTAYKVRGAHNTPVALAPPSTPKRKRS